jgi:hypothetical protein
MEDSESEEEDGSADEADDEMDIGENAKQDDEEDEFLVSLSAWDALGDNFERELANIGKRAFMNCVFFS